MADLEQFRAETRSWLEANCPPEMREPVRDEDDIYWGGRNATFKNDAQKSWFEACRDKGGTPIPTCDEDPTQDRCPVTNPNGGSSFDTRFNSGLILGGLRLGFGGGPAPVAYIPPPVVPETPYTPPPPPVGPV